MVEEKSVSIRMGPDWMPALVGMCFGESRALHSSSLMVYALSQDLKDRFRGFTKPRALSSSTDTQITVCY